MFFSLPYLHSPDNYVIKKLIYTYILTFSRNSPLFVQISCISCICSQNCPTASEHYFLIMFFLFQSVLECIFLLSWILVYPNKYITNTRRGKKPRTNNKLRKFWRAPQKFLFLPSGAFIEGFQRIRLTRTSCRLWFWKFSINRSSVVLASILEMEAWKTINELNWRFWYSHL